MSRESRLARRDEKRVPPHGDYGGPLVSIEAIYEDGTVIHFGHDHPALQKKIAAKK